MRSLFWAFVLLLAICREGLGVGGSSSSLPDQTKARIRLLVERQIRDFGVEIPRNVVAEISSILEDSVAVNLGKMSSSVLEHCNSSVERTLATLGGPEGVSTPAFSEDFKRNLCYNVLVSHLQLVVNRQHFAENIYEVASKNLCEETSRHSPPLKSLFRQDGEVCSSRSERCNGGRVLVTPELAYLISDLIPPAPTREECVVAFMRIMSLPFGLEKPKAQSLCDEVLEMRQSRYFYRSDAASHARADSSGQSHKLSLPPSRLAPFKRAPPFVEITHPQGVGGVMRSTERVSTAKDSIQGFGKLATLPFINSPVQSVSYSEKYLRYSQDHSKLPKHEIPRLNSSEELVFNDDIFSGLIFPCKTLNYEAKIIASMLFYYSNLHKVPLSVEDACITCMRSVMVPAISVPANKPREKKKGVTPSEVINPFVPTCVNALMTISLFSPASRVAQEYIPALKTSENASRAFGKLCSKTMGKYIQVFGMIGIGNHNISCNPAQILLINSLQVSLWSNFNALFASNELAQVACRVNLDGQASQASGECISLMKKITQGMAHQDVQALCQSTVKLLQPQPLVINPILYTISSIFQAVTESVVHKKTSGSKPHISSFIRLAKKILHFSRPKMDPQEFLSSCTALVAANANEKLTHKETHKICKSSSNAILSVILHYHIPLELQLFHKKQFSPRASFIKSTIENYRNLVKKEFSIHTHQ